MSTTERPERWVRGFLLVALASGILAWVIVDPLTKVPIQIDEGHHSVGARYVLLDSSYLVRPELFVGGHEDWTEGARSLMTFPPTANGVFAASLAAFGLGPLGFGLPLFLAGMIVAFSLFLLGRRLFDPWTGVAAAALFLWSAAGLREGSQFECEPFVAAFGTLGLALVAEGTGRRHWGWFAAAGASFGAAFLFKLWIGFAAGVVAIAFLVEGWREDRPARVIGRWAVLALVTVIVSSAHLVVIAILQPEDLATWGYVYFRTIFERLGHEGSRSLVYYPAILYRDMFVLAVPLGAFAAERFGRRTDKTPAEVGRRWFVVLLAVALVAIAVFSKKESAYIYPLMPLLTLLGARGVTSLFEAARRPATRPRSVLLWTGVLAVLAAAGMMLFLQRRVLAEWLSPPFVIFHTAVAGLAALAALGWAVREEVGRVAAALLLVIAVSGGGFAGANLVRSHLEDPLRPVASALAADPRAPSEPRPAGPGQREPTYVSSYWHPLSAFLWERGRPWFFEDEVRRTWQEQLASLSPRVRFFQLDREYRTCTGCPPSPQVHAEIVAWLRATMVDVTPQLEHATGRRSTTLVFRRPDAPRAAQP